MDTTFLVDAERGRLDLDDAVADDDAVAIAAISVAELLVGVALSRGKARTDRQTFLDELLVTVPVLGYDLAVAQAHARLLVSVRERGRPRGAHDLLIAATARASRRTVITADPDAFGDLPGVEARAYR